MSSQKELENYRDSVKKLRKLKLEISNPSIEHAGVLMEELLDYAIEEKMPIKLVSGCLKGDFYQSLISKFKKALDKDIHIDVLVECDEEKNIENKELLSLLKDNANSSITAIPKSDKIINFLLIGNSAYRVETNKEYKTAKGHFDNKIVGGFLEIEFEHYKKLKKN